MECSLGIGSPPGAPGGKALDSIREDYSKPAVPATSDLIFPEDPGHGPEDAIGDAGGAGDDVAPLPETRAAGKVGQLAAGFFDQEQAGRDVPGRQAEFEEAVEDAGRDHREVEGGGPR